MGDERAQNFVGPKKLFHGVCWSILCISLFVGQLASQWLIVELRNWKEAQKNNRDETPVNDSKVATVLFLSLIVFILGVCLICYALVSQHDVYTVTFFAFVILVLFRRAIWCIHKRPTMGTFDWSLTEGNEKKTSTNIISCFILYPAVFMACHHLLWILLGIITEPFWGISVLVAVLSVSAALFFLTCELYKDFPAKERTCTCNCCLACSYCLDYSNYCTSFASATILVLGGFLAFLLLIFLLLVVAQSFLSESLISSLVQNGLVFFSTLWFGKSGYLKLDKPKTKPETKNPAAEEYPLLHVHV